MNGLFTEDVLQKMLESRYCYASNTVLPFVASLTKRIHGFVKKYDSTWMNLFTKNIVRSLL